MTSGNRRKSERALSAPNSVQAYCLEILERGDLESKLAPPVDAMGRPLPDTPSGQPIEIQRPARDHGLRMRGGSERLPRHGQLREREHRARCLARFAHHELQAVELFAWALLRWPALPTKLRRGLLTALTDEQRHCRLYLDRLEAQGGRFDTDDHSDYFWQQAPTIAASEAGALAFLAAMGLTLEQANLDFTLTYRDGFAEAGDHESAAVCQTVHDDEISHVALAAHWMTRLTPAGTGISASTASSSESTDLDAYVAAVPFPMSAARAKGRRFDVAARRRAGLSETMIEHVRKARSNTELGRGAKSFAENTVELLPNLGAEEGEDWRAYREQPAVRSAAHLWCLLFGQNARLRIPAQASARARSKAGKSGKPDWSEHARDGFWPKSLGPPAVDPAFPWLTPKTGVAAWFNTPSLATAAREVLGLELSTPSPVVVPAVHDKAFALEAARKLDLAPRTLSSLIEVLSPEALRAPDELLERLEALLAQWPAWTRRRFTLKPRFGSSGRGRVGGQDRVDTTSIRGALPRLAERGGAIFEPWLDRVGDYSVSLLVPSVEQPEALPTILGSLEMWASPSGVYRGHCGEVDSRGRVFSGDTADESLRADAVGVAELARSAGFEGPAGIDSFRYRETHEPDESTVERMRGSVEFNARPTMGLVTIGLVRRALPLVKEALELSPGDRRGFLLTYLDGDAASREASARRLLALAGDERFLFDLSSGQPGDTPSPMLVFARDLDTIRRTRKEALDC